MSALGHKRTFAVQNALSALLAKADISACNWNVRLGPIADPATLHPLGRTHDTLNHHGRDAREHGLGHWGRQHIGNRARRWRLLLRLGVATAEDMPPERVARRAMVL